LRFVDVIGERYAEIEYRRGKVSQRWRGSDGDWNMRVTFAYLIYWWVFRLFCAILELEKARLTLLL